MSAGPLQVEATGETVGEAKWAALRELEKLLPGLDKSAVQFQVVSEGERGLLGVGYSPARVIAIDRSDARWSRPTRAKLRPRRASWSSGSRSGSALTARVAVREDDETIYVTCSGDELGLLIGKHGQTIDAIQYLANAVARRGGVEAKDVVVDAAGYRDRRRATLETHRGAKRAAGASRGARSSSSR